VTTKDKTGDQLMASIRKAKTETATMGEETGSEPPAVEATPKTAKRGAKPAAARATTRRSPATKKASATKKIPATRKSSATRTSPATEKKVEKAGNAGFQSSKRVWPD
jgi:hypothetical protein